MYTIFEIDKTMYAFLILKKNPKITFKCFSCHFYRLFSIQTFYRSLTTGKSPAGSHYPLNLPERTCSVYAPVFVLKLNPPRK